MLKNFLNKSSVATMAGYMTAVYNSVLVIDIDNLDFSKPSTYLKLFGAIVMPIIAGHVTEIKTKQ